MTILGHLKSLTHLDAIMVAEKEAAEAVQMVASSKIDQVEKCVILFCKQKLYFGVCFNSTMLSL